MSIFTPRFFEARLSSPVGTSSRFPLFFSFFLYHSLARLCSIVTLVSFRSLLVRILLYSAAPSSSLSAPCYSTLMPSFRLQAFFQQRQKTRRKIKKYIRCPVFALCNKIVFYSDVHRILRLRRLNVIRSQFRWCTALETGHARVTIGQGMGDSQRGQRGSLCVISVIDSDSVPQCSGECVFTVTHIPSGANPIMKTGSTVSQRLAFKRTLCLSHRLR